MKRLVPHALCKPPTDKGNSMSLATRVQLVDELLSKLAKTELGEENARQVKRYGDASPPARPPARPRVLAPPGPAADRLLCTWHLACGAWHVCRADLPRSGCYAHATGKCTTPSAWHVRSSCAPGSMRACLAVARHMPACFVLRQRLFQPCKEHQVRQLHS